VSSDLGNPDGDGSDSLDLLVVAFPGVQSFITESRRTGDLHAASRIVATLVTVAARTMADHGAQLIFPDHVSEDEQQIGSPPNRVVAFAPAGGASRIAGAAQHAVHDQWRAWVVKANAPGVDTAECPGFPSIQWVCVPAGADYATRWRLAAQALRARRRVRDFDAQDWAGRKLCSLSPRWPAVLKSPLKSPRDAASEDDTLSAVNWVKRQWPRLESDADEPVRFPSTSSIASAPYRRQLLEALADKAVDNAADNAIVTELKQLRAAWQKVTSVRETPVPGLRASDDLGRWLVRSAGPWVYPSVWEPELLRREYKVTDPDVARSGGAAAARLVELMRDRARLLSYLAVVVQDLDSLGRFLQDGPGSGRAVVDSSWHRQVSRQLSRLGAEQRRVLQDDKRHGVPVYAGGDDLLAFSPAQTALSAVRALQEVGQDTVGQDFELPHASVAVLFFHRGSPLRRALVEARELLRQTKERVPGKHGIGVGFLRRSGVRQFSLQPWLGAVHGSHEPDGVTTAELFEVFTRPTAAGRTLSPRLVPALERDAAELADISSLSRDTYDAELARMVTRHGGDRDEAAALSRLGLREYGPAGQGSTGRSSAAAAGGGGGSGSGGVPVRAARVALFLRQECSSGSGGSRGSGGSSGSGELA